MPLHRKRDRPYIRAVFHLIGAFALAIGIWKLVSTVQFLHHAKHSVGHVVARVGDPNATDSGAHPDIVFTDQAGATVRYNQNGMGSRPVGTPIPVLYDPAAPAATAVADSFWQLWLTVILSFWLGLGFTAGALWGEVYSSAEGA